MEPIHHKNDGDHSWTPTLAGSLEQGNNLNKSLKAFSLFFLALSVLFCINLKVWQYYSFSINEFDTGIYFNLIHNITSKGEYYSSVLSKSHLGEHFSPIVLILTPIYMISDSAIWILISQGLSIGLACVALYFIGLSIFDKLEENTAILLSLFFVFWAIIYQPLHRALLFEFHPSTLATSLLAAAILALHYKRDWILAALVFFLLLSKENAALAVAGLGLYAGFVLHRPKIAFILLSIAAASAALIMGFIMPAARTGEWGHLNRIAPFSYPYLKLLYIFFLLKSLAFLPLLSWRSLLAVIPLISINLIVGYKPQFSSMHHYDDFASIMLLVSAMHGMNWLVVWIKTRNGYWLQLSSCAVVSLFILLVTLPDALKIYDLKYIRQGQTADEQLLFEELAAIRAVPREVGIASDGRLVPYVAGRDRFVSLRKKLDFSTPEIEGLLLGDLVVISPMRNKKKFARYKEYFDFNPAYKLKSESKMLNVYERVI